MTHAQQTARHKPVLGLIGGIGSGKSTIARLMASMGCAVIDADDLARRELDDPVVRDELVSWWGPAMLDPSGRVARKAVADIVFRDSAQLARLEAVIHPRVNRRRAELRRQYQADPAVIAIVEDCPLLLEKQLDSDCDYLIFVEAADQTRLARVAAARGWTQAELREREKSQLGLDIKAQRADYVISNNDGEAQSALHVRRVLSQILQQAT